MILEMASRFGIRLSLYLFRIHIILPFRIKLHHLSPINLLYYDTPFHRNPLSKILVLSFAIQVAEDLFIFEFMLGRQKLMRR